METTWRVRVQPRWGHVALGDIKPTAVQSWMAELGQSTDERKAIGAAAVKRAHHSCRASWLTVDAAISDVSIDFERAKRTVLFRS